MFGAALMFAQSSLKRAEGCRLEIDDPAMVEEEGNQGWRGGREQQAVSSSPTATYAEAHCYPLPPASPRVLLLVRVLAPNVDRDSARRAGVPRRLPGPRDDPALRANLEFYTGARRCEPDGLLIANCISGVHMLLLDVNTLVAKTYAQMGG
jgi:hypothetical protein